MERRWKVRASAAEFPHANPALDWGALWLGSELDQADEPEIGAEEDSPAEARPAPSAIRQESSAVTAEGALEPAPSAIVLVPPEPPATRTADEPATTSEQEALPPVSVAAPEKNQDVTTGAKPAAEKPAPKGLKRISPAKSFEQDADPWSSFVDATAEVARRIAGEEAAAAARSALADGTVDGALPASVEASLVDAGVLSRRSDAAEDGAANRAVSEGFATSARAWRAILVGESQELAACGGATTLDDWAARLVFALAAQSSAQSAIKRELRREGVAAFGMLEPATHRPRSTRARISDTTGASAPSEPAMHDGSTVAA